MKFIDINQSNNNIYIYIKNNETLNNEGCQKQQDF